MPAPIERRSFPRPPLWLNLTLLILAAAIFAYARYQRSDIDRRTALLLRRSENSPAAINHLRDELASMKLTEADLSKQLDARMSFFRAIQSSEFYIAIDPRKQLFQFRLGDDVVREATAQIGPRVASGAFQVTGKEQLGDGAYVIFLPYHRVITTPTNVTAPGMIIVPQADLAAIWPRISTNTKVFIF